MIGRRLTITATAVALLGVMAVGAPVALGAPEGTPCRVRNITRGTTGTSLKLLLAKAKDGDRLTVQGSCSEDGISIGVDIRIRGVGDRRAVLDAHAMGSVLLIRPATTVRLRHLVIRGGHALDDRLVGGGIANLGTLTLTDSVVEFNKSHKEGGGIFNNGTLTLTDTVVRRNSSQSSSGAGIYSDNGTVTLTRSDVRGNYALAGGGIYNHGTMTLTDSMVRRNTARYGGGGIYNGGTLTLDDSSVTGNEADNGGGIYNGSVGTVTLAGTASVTGNTPDDCFGTTAC